MDWSCFFRWFVFAVKLKHRSGKFEQLHCKDISGEKSVTVTPHKSVIKWPGSLCVGKLSVCVLYNEFGLLRRVEGRIVLFFKIALVQRACCWITSV